MALLSAKSLSVSIGPSPVLHNISIEVNPGEIVALVGESGSGKSTTVLAMLDLLPMGGRMTGDVRFNGDPLPLGDDAAMCRIRGKGIGFVSQEPMTALNPLMTIGDQVMETVRQHSRVSRSEARKQAAAMLERVAMPASRFPLSRYPHELSGGQRQRVAIAMALVASPRVLLADEPTTALDVTTQAQILELLKELVAERDMGLLLVTHDLGVVAQVADRVAIMQTGEIVEQGETLAIFRSMSHPYSRKLMEATTHVPVRASAPEAGAPPVLEVEDIVRTYPVPRRTFLGPRAEHRAVDQVSFTLGRGESLGIVGESGSGKSTLLRTILALEQPQAGSVRVDGKPFSVKTNAAEQRALRRKIQMVFQDPYGSFDPRWRVERLVSETLALTDEKISASERRHKVEQVLERVGLSAADADRFPHEFSGGQRQRIAIARALIVEPEIIALDEAVSALDVSVRAHILDLLAKLSDESGMSYVFVTHDLSVVRAVADRVLVMRNGKVVEEGETSALFEAPRHPYTRELLAATPVIERALERRTSPAATDQRSTQR